METDESTWLTANCRLRCDQNTAACSLLRTKDTERSKPCMPQQLKQTGLTSLNFSYLTSWDLSFCWLSPLRHPVNQLSNIIICGSRISRKWDLLRVGVFPIPDPQRSSPNSHFVGCFGRFDFLNFWLYHTRYFSILQDGVLDKNTNLDLCRISKIVRYFQKLLTGKKPYSMIQNCRHQYACKLLLPIRWSSVKIHILQ